MVGQLATIIPKVPENQAKIVAFCSSMAGFEYMSFAPPERGGRGDQKAKVMQQAAETGRPIAEVADDVSYPWKCRATNGC